MAKQYKILAKWIRDQKILALNNRYKLIMKEKNGKKWKLYDNVRKQVQTMGLPRVIYLLDTMYESYGYRKVK